MKRKIIISLLSIVLSLSIMLGVVFVAKQNENTTKSEATDVIEGLSADLESEELKGGAIYLEPNAEFTMKGGYLANHTNTYGGAVYVSKGATFTMEGGTIDTSTATYGGSIYVAKGGTLKFEGGTIKAGETTQHGGAIYVEAGGNLIIGTEEVSGHQTSTGVVIEDCKSTKNGGAIYLENASNLVNNSEFTIKSCLGEYGGAIYSKVNELTLNNANIESCTATNLGGAFYVDTDTRFNMTEVEIVDCADSQGSAIHVVDGGIIEIKTGTTIEHKGLENAVGIYVADGGTADILEVYDMNAKTFANSIASIQMQSDNADVILSKQTVKYNVDGTSNQIENTKIYGNYPEASWGGVKVADTPKDYQDCCGYFVDSNYINPATDVTNRKILVDNLEETTYYTRTATKDKLTITEEGLVSCVNTNITGDVVIPRESESGVTVVGVKRSGFEECASITGVYLSTNVGEIQIGSFAYCSGINKSVNIPTSVTKIKTYAFLGAFSNSNTFTRSNRLQLQLHAGVKEVGFAAFGFDVWVDIHVYTTLEDMQDWASEWFFCDMSEEGWRPSYGLSIQYYDEEMEYEINVTSSEENVSDSKTSLCYGWIVVEWFDGNDGTRDVNACGYYYNNNLTWEFLWYDTNSSTRKFVSSVLVNGSLITEGNMYPVFPSVGEGVTISLYIAEANGGTLSMHGINISNSVDHFIGNSTYDPGADIIVVYSVQGVLLYSWKENEYMTLMGYFYAMGNAYGNDSLSMTGASLGDGLYYIDTLTIRYNSKVEGIDIEEYMGMSGDPAEDEDIQLGVYTSLMIYDGYLYDVDTQTLFDDWGWFCIKNYKVSGGIALEIVGYDYLGRGKFFDHNVEIQISSRWDDEIIENITFSKTPEAMAFVIYSKSGVYIYCGYEEDLLESRFIDYEYYGSDIYSININGEGILWSSEEMSGLTGETWIFDYGCYIYYDNGVYKLKNKNGDIITDWAVACILQSWL